MSFLISGTCAILLIGMALPLVLLVDWVALLKLEEPAFGQDVRSLIVVVVIVLGLSFIAMIPRQFMFGRLHGYLAHGLDFIGVVVGAGGLIASIHLGAPMWVMALSFIGPSVVLLFFGGIIYLLQERINPFSIAGFDAALFRRVRNDSVRMSGYHLAFSISTQTDMLLIGIILGSAATVDFGIAHRVFSLVVMVSLVLNQAQWPALARADAAGDSVKLLLLFRRTLILLPLVAVALAVCIVLLYVPLVSLWLGVTLGTDPLILWGMVAWVGVATVANTCDTLIRARNETTILMNAMVVMAMLNLSITFLLLPLVGAAGAIWGSVIGYFLALVLPYLWHLRADLLERVD